MKKEEEIVDEGILAEFGDNVIDDAIAEEIRLGHIERVLDDGEEHYVLTESGKANIAGKVSGTWNSEECEPSDEGHDNS